MHSHHKFLIFVSLSIKCDIRHQRRHIVLPTDLLTIARELAAKDSGKHWEPAMNKMGRNGVKHIHFYSFSAIYLNLNFTLNLLILIPNEVGRETVNDIKMRERKQ